MKQTIYENHRHTYQPSFGIIQAIKIMAKRKSCDSALTAATNPPYKRVKLAHSPSEIRAPSPSATPERPQKRKRTDLLQTDAPDTKRVRIEDSADVWPGIWEGADELSEEEEPDAIARKFRETCYAAMQMGTNRMPGYRRRRTYQSYLQSPEPSDPDTGSDNTDTGGSDISEPEHPATKANARWINSAPISRNTPYARTQMASPPYISPRKISGSRVSTKHHRRNPTQRQKQQPALEKESQQRRKKCEEQSENNKSTPAVNEFLRSKRSSRRDAEQVLWYLGDDGKAYKR